MREAAREPVYLVGGAVRDLLLGPPARRRRPGRRGRRGGAGGAAGRRRAASTSASAPSRSRSTGTRSTSPAPAPRPIRSRGRCRWSLPPRASRPTSPAATSRSTRWRSRSQGEPRLIDPHGGARRPRGGPAAGPASALLRGRPDPGDPRRPLRGRASASRSSRRPSELLRAGRPRDRLRRPPPGRAGAPRRPNRPAASASSLLAEWGLIDLREGGVELMQAVEELLKAPHWAELVPARAGADRRGAGAGRGRAGAGLDADAEARARAVEVAERRDPVELILGRALGADWLDRYLTAWRKVELEIDGDDLIAAGVPAGAGGRPRPAGGAAASGWKARSPAASRSSPRRWRRPRVAPRVTAMEWRERDGVRWLRGRPRRRPRGLLDPPRRRQRAALRQPQPRPADRRRRRGGGGEPPPPRRRPRFRARAGRLRPPGPRHPPDRAQRAASSPVPLSARADKREHGNGCRRPMGTSCASRDWRRWSLRRGLPAGGRRGPGGVAMLHAGWRGLAGGILAAGAEAVGATSAAIGPGIGPCCYEVGRGGAGRLLAASARASPRGGCSTCPRWRGGSWREAGVERVESAGLCTSCEAELFFSHRRDAGPHRPPGAASPGSRRGRWRS